MRRLAKLILCSLVLVGTGCGKFTYEKTYDVKVGGVNVINIDAPTRQQTVKVKATSTNNVPISVYLVLEKGIDSVQKDLLDYKPPDKSSVLDSKEKTTEANLEAKVPAKQAYAVILAAATKDTQVTVKIEGN
jgi:hypothetical protein